MLDTGNRSSIGMVASPPVSIVASSAVSGTTVVVVVVVEVVEVGGGEVVVEEVAVVEVGGGEIVVEEVAVVVVGLAALAVVGVASGTTVLEQAVARTAIVTALTHRCHAISSVCPPAKQNWRRVTEAGLVDGVQRGAGRWALVAALVERPGVAEVSVTGSVATGERVAAGAVAGSCMRSLRGVE